MDGDGIRLAQVTTGLHTWLQVNTLTQMDTNQTIPI